MYVIVTPRTNVSLNFNGFRRLIDTVQQWKARRATRRALLSLSDTALDDIGLSRWTVEHDF